MTNEANIYNALKLLNVEVEEVELPFEEHNFAMYTKEDCFKLVRDIHTQLVQAGIGPYTLLQFRERSNAIARKCGEYKDYYKLCCEYVERCLMKKNTRISAQKVDYTKEEGYLPY